MTGRSTPLDYAAWRESRLGAITESLGRATSLGAAFVATVGRKANAR